MHLGEFSPVLMPTEPRGRAKAVEWLFAALNSVERASLPGSFFQFGMADRAASKPFDDFPELGPEPHLR